jgi:hypothetical protein
MRAGRSRPESRGWRRARLGGGRGRGSAGPAAGVAHGVVAACRGSASLGADVVGLGGSVREERGREERGRERIEERGRESGGGCEVPGSARAWELGFGKYGP